jgi:hypothetical protein
VAVAVAALPVFRVLTLTPRLVLVVTVVLVHLLLLLVVQFFTLVVEVLVHIWAELQA